VNISKTLLLSRSSANIVGQFRTVLPARCVLDTILDSDRGVLWVLDILSWRDVSLSEGQADFRMFWNRSRLSELPYQPYARDSVGSPPQQLLVLPIPSLNVPMTSSKILDRLNACLSPTQSVNVTVLSPQSAKDMMQTDGPQPPINKTETIDYVPDGIIFFVASAVYESGSSCLAAWVSVENGSVQALRDLLLSTDDSVALMDAD